MEYLGPPVHTSQSFCYYLRATQDGYDLVSLSRSATFWQKLELESPLPPSESQWKFLPTGGRIKPWDCPAKLVLMSSGL